MFNQPYLDLGSTPITRAEIKRADDKARRIILATRILCVPFFLLIGYLVATLALNLFAFAKGAVASSLLQASFIIIGCSLLMVALLAAYSTWASYWHNARKLLTPITTDDELMVQSLIREHPVLERWHDSIVKDRPLLVGELKTMTAFGWDMHEISKRRHSDAKSNSGFIDLIKETP